MKTANVLKTKGQDTNYPAVLKKVSVNHALSPLNDKKRKPEAGLSIHGYVLREWLEHLNGSEGVYFLDFKKAGEYSLHFKHHSTGQLMELEQPLNDKTGMLDYLEMFLFDLSLFSDTPVLAFDASTVETELRVIEGFYPEHTKEIEKVIGRLVNIDMKSLFKENIFHEPRIKQFTIDGIYSAFFPGTSRSFIEQGSYGMYLIYLAMESIFYQITGKPRGV